MTRHLKIYSSRDFLPDGAAHVPLLLPFWGANAEDPQNPLTGRFARFESCGQQWFTMTGLGDADVAVYPTTWRPEDNLDRARRFADEARAAGKPLLLFSEHDSTASVDVANTVAVRCSLLASQRRPAEFAQPAWSEDLLARYYDGVVNLRPKRDVPLVSYCGYSAVGITSMRGRVEFALGANPRIHGLVSALGYDLIRQTGPRVRTQAIHVLSRARQVHTNFVIRERGFWDHVQRATGRVRRADIAHQWRRDFADNIINSDYVLCTRGFGNFSYRLYETLCCGRIPVFLNTDCVLPFENLIDWRLYTVWVEEQDIANIAQRVAQFHERLSASDFLELQRSCRRLWEEWLSPEGFFKNLHRYLAAIDAPQTELLVG